MHFSFVNNAKMDKAISMKFSVNELVSCMCLQMYFCNTNNISQQDYNTSNSKIIQRSSKINFQSYLCHTLGSFFFK
jgi:hypothetical protein